MHMILAGSKDNRGLVAGNGLLKLALVVVDDVYASIGAALTPSAVVELFGIDTRTLTTTFESDFPSMNSIHSCKTEKIDLPP